MKTKKRFLDTIGFLTSLIFMIPTSSISFADDAAVSPSKSQPDVYLRYRSENVDVVNTPAYGGDDLKKDAAATLRHFKQSDYTKQILADLSKYLNSDRSKNFRELFQRSGIGDNTKLVLMVQDIPSYNRFRVDIYFGEFPGGEGTLSFGETVDFQGENATKKARYIDPKSGRLNIEELDKDLIDTTHSIIQKRKWQAERQAEEIRQKKELEAMIEALRKFMPSRSSFAPEAVADRTAPATSIPAQHAAGDSSSAPSLDSTSPVVF